MTSPSRSSPAFACCLPTPRHGSTSRRAPVTLADLVPFIDWSPFFHTWELRGRYPAILEERRRRRTAVRGCPEAAGRNRRPRTCSLRAASMASSRPTAVGDDVELYTDESRPEVLTTFHFLRQQMEKPQDQFNHCLADFIAPSDAQTTTALARLPRRFRRQRRVRHGGAVPQVRARPRRLQLHHGQGAGRPAGGGVRRIPAPAGPREWGYGKSENLTNEELIREKLPRHPPGRRLSRLPRPHREADSLGPARRGEEHRHQADRKLRHVARRSVSGLYFAHPRVQVFRRRQNRPRPGARLPPAQADGFARPSNAGWALSEL